LRATALTLLLAAGCEPIEPTATPSGLFEARPDAVTTAPTAPTPDAPTPPGGFDFDADAPDAEAPPESDTTRADVLSGLGLPTSEADAVPLGPVEPVTPPVAEPAPVQAAGWTPAMGMAGSFGVRLVATLPNAQPPRAILGLADGREVVVEPGTLLPDARIVVLAIGRDAAHVAEIVPEGDRARVVPSILTALQPSGAFARE
jgi:hypothetical protein